MHQRDKKLKLKIPELVLQKETFENNSFILDQPILEPIHR